MSVKELIAVTENMRILASTTATHNSVTEAAFDFGTPNDIDLEALAEAGTYKPGDRILVLFTAVGDGSADTVFFTAYDAPDDAGSIGTPVAAVTDGDLSGGTAAVHALAAIKVQAGRPWLRFGIDASGATDTFTATCTVLAVSRTGV